ncbi:uncharacterized protein BO66DRAFT_441108 [Aspergillus aculeatinus CBS 121060]|uniref:Uncharacterized protein n=1 Tax=Aspergillus aculeatinus CBS 121060 TaxID=1448322 RepID=A0ACD1H1Q9_9EURO|nr:hypothetical protein BO66DRAFT_441108 [Aspergillus aculeatinus CBS 121060]RAH67389.1 hypothetical protein BO66DRAFT_441108 [Aspergillus aculeatinus CBS 121060]
MTRKVNAVIKAAAQDLQRMGVIYVDGLQDAYNGHRFCEPGATKEQTEYIVRFWSQYSHFDTPSEGRAEDDVEATIRPPFPVLRSFHPKGTAYAEHATALFAAIADNRAAIATGGEGQQIAIALYIHPLGDPGSWERIFAYDTKKVSVLVADVLNGPDYVVDTVWKSMIDQAASQGKKILGYVRTGYLGVSQQQFTTRLGSHDLADWASQIEQDVDKWSSYMAPVSAVSFLMKAGRNAVPTIFTQIFLNPGSPIAQCFEDTMDTLLTFESSYETCMNSFVPNDWMPKDQRKIWHTIYKVPQNQTASVAAFASSRNAGLLEITNDNQPNPYDNPPDEAYKQAVIGAVPGGTPFINGPVKVITFYVAGLPSDVVVSSTDYSSAILI